MTLRQGRLQFKRGRMMRTSLFRIHTMSIPPTIGPLTRARAHQLNHEVSSFLSVPLYFDNYGMLLNNCDVLLLRNTGEEQQGRPSQGGGPIKFESVSESRTSLH